MSKQKKCRICKEPYQPFNSTQPTCGKYECQVKFAEQHVNKAQASRNRLQRAQTRADKERLKPKSKLLKEAEMVINKYVRLRDYHLGCVSCDKPPSWNGQWHASHFRSVKAASAIRYNLWNIHKSCSICNKWLSSNHEQYEPRIRAKIGNEKVDWLKTQNQRADYSIEYLKRLKKIFSKKTRMRTKRLK